MGLEFSRLVSTRSGIFVAGAGVGGFCWLEELKSLGLLLFFFIVRWPVNIDS